MKFKTSPVTIHLYGHGLAAVGSITPEPKVSGTFAADPVTGNDGEIFGVFTIADPEGGEYPSGWAGTYRVNAERLRVSGEDVFSEI